MKRFALAVAFLFVVACSGHAQVAGEVQGETSDAKGGLSESQLEDLVAPIALYPDALVDQILDASQYPSDLVAAGDFMSNSTDGQQPDPSWPASILALLKYPSVLSSLDDKLAWTTRLGNAVKTRRSDVENAIQEARKKAQAAGNLASDDKQKLVTENNVIRIVPANPEVIYVPAYDPTLIYATAQNYGTPFITYGTGFAVGAATAHSLDWDWYRHNYWNWHHHHYYDHHYPPLPPPHHGPYYDHPPYNGTHPHYPDHPYGYQPHPGYHPNYGYHPHYNYHPNSFHGGDFHGGFHGGGAHFHGGGRR